MPNVTKNFQNFPFFSDLLKSSQPEECVGLGIWTGDDMAIWLRCESASRCVGIIDAGRLAIETHFLVDRSNAKSIRFAGDVPDAGKNTLLPLTSDQLERVVALAATLSRSMHCVAMASERALANARACQTDRSSGLFLEGLTATQDLFLSRNGDWRPVFLERRL